MADTRKDRRAPVSLKVRFKSATVDEFVEQYAMDISRGGIFIKSKSPMPVGTLLKFEFQLKDESRLIHGVGRVVWKRDAAVNDENPPGMGIKFIKMDPASRQLVEQIVGQRGDQPGEFEQGAGRVRSAKKTEQFFPAPAPASALPAPEDSTQVRHASEFLAEALAAGDEDAAKEAAQRADEARRRTEEIERQRAEQSGREKVEREAREKAEKEAAEKKRAEDEAAARRIAEKNAAAEAVAARAKADAGLVPIGSKDDVGEDESTSIMEGKAAQLAFEAELDELARGGGDEELDLGQKPAAKEAAKPAAKPAFEPAPKRDSGPSPATARTSTPEVAAETKSSLTLPLSIAAIVLLGVGGFFVYQQMNAGAAVEPTPSANPPAEASTETETPGETAEVEGEGEAVAEAVPEEPAVMMTVHVETTPRGATILVGDEERGAAPLDIEVAQGREVEIVARKDGMVTARQTITPAEGMAPVRLQLEPLPWVLVVNATPADAAINVAGRAPNAQGEIVLAGAPSGPVLVTATKAGFQRTTGRVMRTGFTQEGERMIARLDLTLTEQARGAAGGGRAGGGMRATGTDAAGGGETGGGTTDTSMAGGGTTDTSMAGGGTTDTTDTADTTASTMDSTTSTMDSTSSMDIPDNPF
jgi:uncharacterized protein (TIGR02266 family)